MEPSNGASPLTTGNGVIPVVKATKTCMVNTSTSQ